MFQVFLFSSQSFEGILPGEKVLILKRKHKIFFYLPIFLFLFLSFLITFLVSFINPNLYQKFSDLILFLEFVLFSIFWQILFFDLMTYSLTTFIVTNKRIIKIEQKGLFNYNRSDLELDKIQDITVNISGLLGNFLNFGDILIQTASAENKFNIYSLPNPLKIKNDILKIKNDVKNNSI